MLLMHLGDLHFGKIVNEFNMLEDQRHVAAQVVQMAGERRPDGILLAGDIYDRNIPPAAAVELFDEFLTALSRLDIPVFLISGNHDSPERLSFGGRLFVSKKVYISCSEETAAQPVRLKDEEGEVGIWLLPFMKTENMKAALEKMAVDEKKRNVLVTHCFILNGTKSPELSDSESPVYVGGIDGLEFSAFDKFDYVALGHLHKPQSVGRPQVRYCGSWLKYSFSEAGRDKSVTFIRLGKKGDVDIFTEPLKPLRDMRKIRGALEKLISPEVSSLGNPEDYLHVTLTDEKALLDPMGALRSVYPNVMQLAFERSREKSSDRFRLAPGNAALKSEKELFGDFYGYVMGSQMDESRKELMEVVIDEAQKADH